MRREPAAAVDAPQCAQTLGKTALEPIPGVASRQRIMRDDAPTKPFSF
jgi:hypothetical protein